MSVSFKTILASRASRLLSPWTLKSTSVFPIRHRNLTFLRVQSSFFSSVPASVQNERYCGSYGSSMKGIPSIPVSTPTSLLTCRTYSKKGRDKGKGGKPHKKVVLSSEQLEGLVDMDKVTDELDHVLEDLKDKFIHQITVRTSQGAFDNLIVKTPEGNFPLIQLGQVLQKSPQLLTINLASSPQYITQVKEALSESGLNINPQQEGTSLFIPLPKVTREHRENLAKNAKMLSEKAKKHLREIYSKHSRKIKSAKSGHSSDDLVAADTMVQDLMHDKMKQVEAMTSAKQQELLGGK